MSDLKKYKKIYSVKEINSVKDMMEQAIKECPDKIAYRYREDKKIIDVTFKEFYDLTLNLGASLNSLGVSNKHVACIGDNSFEWVTVYFTVLKSDNVLVPVDKELPVKDIIYVLNHSDSNILFYSERYEEHIDNILANCPKLETVICFEKEKDDGKSKLSYKQLIKKGKDIKSFEEHEHDTKKMKLIIYTSGTTGLAKGVMLSEFNLIRLVTSALSITSLEKNMLSVLPYHHTYESSCDILVGMHNHATICINDSLKHVLNNLQEFKPSGMMIVPAFAELFYKKIWSTAEKEGKDKLLRRLIKISNGLRRAHIDLRGLLFKSVRNAFGGNLKQLICGGAPLRAEIGDFFNDIGIMMQNGYGITECSPLVAVNTPLLNDPKTVGLPIICVDVKTENVTEDGFGEICVKGDSVMLGYYKDEEKTKEVLHDGWFNTGDYGLVNDKGQIVIVGRKKNFFVLANGKNIYPEEIENYIVSIPYVQDAIVKASTNIHGMNASNLMTEVYLNQDAVAEMGDIDVAKKLKNDINEKTRELPTYKKIAEIIIRDEPFEKTTTNKIKR